MADFTQYNLSQLKQLKARVAKEISLEIIQTQLSRTPALAPLTHNTRTSELSEALRNKVPMFRCSDVPMFRCSDVPVSLINANPLPIREGRRGAREDFAS